MPDLPRGAVTFLFTDIEGSTRLVKQLRDRYHEVLASAPTAPAGRIRAPRRARDRHAGRLLLRRLRERARCSPGRRRRATRAREPSWPEGAAVKVRMGVHTGQASPSDGRYTGVAVHRAARIGAAGHGGQVLVSQATQTLLEDEEEDLGIEFRDLGSQPLKGLDRPVHLYQVAAPGLRTEFPPLRGEEDAKAVAVARPRHSLRSPWFLLAAGALLLIGTALAAVLLSRGGGERRPVARPPEQRRRHRPEDEPHRRRGAGRHPARPDCRRWRLGLGREHRRPDADARRSRRRARMPARSRSTTRRRPGSPAGRGRCGSLTGSSGGCRASTRSSTG